MLAALPALLDNLGKTEVLAILYVGDDLNAHTKSVGTLELWMLLHDSNQGDDLKIPHDDHPLPPETVKSNAP